MRIATVLPSATEIVCALGLEDQLVGVSHSCNFPPGVQALPTLTSTHVPYQQDSATIDRYVREHLTAHEALYDLDMAALRDARPDVIISQTLCDVCAVSSGDVIGAINDLPGQPQLIDLQPHSLQDVFDDILHVGQQLQATDAAKQLVATLQQRLDLVRQRTAGIPTSARKRVVFLEWLLPPFNGGHWNSELVEAAGGIDLLGVKGLPSSTQNWQHIARLDPDVIYVACCGLSVERAHEDIGVMADNPEWRQLRAVRNGHVIVADGNAYFSCPGPRLIDGLEIMQEQLLQLP